MVYPIQTKNALVSRQVGRTFIRLENQEFPAPIIFGEKGYRSFLGPLALEESMLTVDVHDNRLINVEGCPLRYWS